MKPVIRTEDLIKEYNGFKAVDSINLRVEKGEIYGFMDLITSYMSFSWLITSIIFFSSAGTTTGGDDSFTARSGSFRP